MQPVLIRVGQNALILMLLIFFGVVVYKFALGYEYMHYPRAPNYRTGQVVSYPWKSTTIYLTAAESQSMHILDLLQYCSVVLGVISFGALNFAEKKAR